MVALLTDDAWLSMPPAPHQYHGTGAIRSFLHAAFTHRGGRHLYLVPTRANTQPALAGYLSDPARAVGFYVHSPHGEIGRATGLLVLTLSGDRISAMTHFDNSVLPGFGLPRMLPR